MEVSVTLSANAGVALEMGGRRLWVDALHEEKQVGFSTLTPALQKKMLACSAFSHPELICYTHLHPDHYSEKLTAVARQLWPNAKVLMPGENAECDGLNIEFLRLPHEGEQYAATEHYGILASFRGYTVFFSGDCAVASPALSDALNGRKIDLAVLDFPWATLRKGRAFLEEHFAGTEILLYHLPFAEDDELRYRESAVKAAGNIPGCRVLMDAFQMEKYNF